MSDEDDDTLPSVLAVPCVFTFVPEEAETEYLIGFVEGRYDSLNEGMPGADVEKEREMARTELRRRDALNCRCPRRDQPKKARARDRRAFFVTSPASHASQLYPLFPLSQLYPLFPLYPLSPLYPPGQFTP